MEQTHNPVYAAMDYAGRPNAGSSFETREVCTAGLWSRVSLLQVWASREEAVAFDVFIMKKDDGYGGSLNTEIPLHPMICLSPLKIFRK